MDKLLNSFLVPMVNNKIITGSFSYLDYLYVCVSYFLLFCALYLQGTTKDPICSESSSTLTSSRTQNSPDLVRVILPANRCRDYSSTLSYSSNPFHIDKRNPVGKRNLDKSEHIVVDLTEDDIQDGKRGKGIIASCSVKKTKLVKTEDDLCQHTNFQEEQSACSISSKCNKQEILGNSEIMQNAQNGSSIFPGAAVTAKNGNLQLSCHNNQGAVSSSTPCVDEEKRGSTFLSQVITLVDQSC